MKRFGALAAVNIFVFFVLAAGVAFLPPALYDLYHLVRAQLSHASDKRAQLPNYAGLPWAKTFFNESLNLKFEYFDYIVWRLRPFAGTTINIDKDGYRRNLLPQDVEPGAAQTWFFGGSTMWGYGVRDSNTIAAEFVKVTSTTDFNFGETAYVSHQSLNVLMKAYLAGGRPQSVVFYDGYNNVEQGCRRTHSLFASMEEEVIRGYVDAGSRWQSGSQLLEVFSPTVRVFKALSKNFRKSEKITLVYDCAGNAAKAHRVALALAADWAAAKSLVEANGGRFMAVLQPVPYLGAPNLTYIPAVAHDVTTRKQFEAVYSELRKILAERKFPYLDLTRIYDGKELFYIDYCHVTPNGNHKIAQAIAASLQ